MLLLLIPIAWLLVATFVLLLCRASARGDASPGRPAELAQPRASAGGLTLWEDLPAEGLQVRRNRPAQAEAAAVSSAPARSNGKRGSLVHP
jgi:hypothetical protein